MFNRTRNVFHTQHERLKIILIAIFAKGGGATLYFKTLNATCLQYNFPATYIELKSSYDAGLSKVCFFSFHLVKRVSNIPKLYNFPLDSCTGGFLSFLLAFAETFERS